MRTSGNRDDRRRTAATHRRRRVGTNALTVAALAVGALTSASALAKAPQPGPRIDVLSNRTDVISGGDALVAIHLPSGLTASTVTVRLRGHDVTNRFAVRPNGRFEALLTGLSVGRSTLTASAPGRRTDSVTIVNHAHGGPTLSGPP